MSFASRRAACLFGEVFGTDLQGPADPVERIAFAVAAPEGVLLDPAADLVDHGQSQFHDVVFRLIGFSPEGSPVRKSSMSTGRHCHGVHSDGHDFTQRQVAFK